MKTLEEQLEAVQKAIANAEEAIEYSVGTRKVRRSELNILYAREKDLLSRIANKTNSDNGGLSYIQWGRS